MSQSQEIWLLALCCWSFITFANYGLVGGQRMDKSLFNEDIFDIPQDVMKCYRSVVIIKSWYRKNEFSVHKKRTIKLKLKPF